MNRLIFLNCGLVQFHGVDPLVWKWGLHAGVSDSPPSPHAILDVEGVLDQL